MDLKKYLAERQIKFRINERKYRHMGYTTDFTGEFIITPKLTDEHKQFLIKFNKTRRMARNVPKCYGVEGEFYVEGEGSYGQDHELNIIDYNLPPKTQPGLWCQWRPDDSGELLMWYGGEKFYNYVEWLEYLIEKFFKPNGYTIKGQVDWQGEDENDYGSIVVNNNEVSCTT